MPNVRAFRSGNWSDTNTTTSPWATGGVLYAPNSSDDVFANGFTVTVDNSPTVVSVTNASATSRAWKDGATTTASSGGGLILSNGQTLTATTGALTTVVANFITLSGINSAAFVGNVTGNATTGYSLINTGSGTLTFTGYAEAIGSGTGGIFRNQSGGNLIINGGFTSSAVLLGAFQDAGGNLIVNGYASSSGLAGISNGGVGTVTVVGTMTASNGGGNAIRSTNTASLVKASGSFICAADGTMAVAAIKMILNTTPIAAKTRYALNGTGTYVDMFTADNTGLAPAVGDVRAGVVYGSATGTLAVPAANSVAFGVAVDNTTGTAVLTLANVQSALTAQGLTSARAGNLDNLDAAVSTRLSPSGTLARVTLTDTATTLTNAPTVPTAAEIATAVEGSLLNEADGQAVLNAIVGAIGNTNLSEVSLVAAVRADLERNGGKLDSIPTTAAPSASAVAGAVRTELGVELGRLDASVSSRLAPSGTLATVTNLTNAPASVTPSDIWSHAARTLTSASGPTAAEIRQEIDANSTKLDAAISSRMAASEATKLDSIKGKTDLLNTDRLSQVATTNIVGTLLAQANS